MNRDIKDMRQRYELAELNEKEMDKNPFDQFKIWFKTALDSDEIEPNGMSLATADKLGNLSCRTVLLKEIMEEGYVFYTNYDSKKGIQIQENDKAAVLFWWKMLQRQVRIEGCVSKISKERSLKYFQSRPKGSQIGATISPQSKGVRRDELKKAYNTVEEMYNKQDKLPLPENWGGYILKPNLFEFWQGRPSRLHDRIQYKLEANEWLIERLAP